MDPNWRCIPYWKWWFSIAMLVYQRVNSGNQNHQILITTSFADNFGVQPQRSVTGFSTKICFSHHTSPQSFSNEPCLNCSFYFRLVPFIKYDALPQTPTADKSPKNDAWKTLSFPFGKNGVLFRGEISLVKLQWFTAYPIHEILSWFMTGILSWIRILPACRCPQIYIIKPRKNPSCFPWVILVV